MEFATAGSCPACHSHLSPGARFCGACGASSGTVGPAPAPALHPTTPAAVVRSLGGDGFLRSLFDLSFSSFVTTKVVKLVYLLTLLAIGLLAVFFVIAGFSQSPALGAVVLLILAPLSSLFYAVYARVLLEFIIAVFRIAEYQRDLLVLAQHQAASVAPAPPAPSPAAVAQA
jgi:hypothetical protein